MSTRTYNCTIITGASSGLGEEFALQLAPHCKRLILIARRAERLDLLAKSLKETHPNLLITTFPTDLSLPSERATFLSQLAEQQLIPDLLVNNAGLGDYGEFTSSDWQKTAAMLQVNIDALTHLSHALLPSMIANQHGAILNVSSLASTLPIPDFAVYAATKAYVTSFSEALHIEVKNHGITVLAVCPGPVHTEFGKTARRNQGSHQAPGYDLFYVSKNQVVAESIQALSHGNVCLYPGKKIKLAALVIRSIPICILRKIMQCRPRKNKPAAA